MLRQISQSLVVAVMLFIPYGAARQQPDSPSASEIKIQIKSARPKVALGEPIDLVVSITNEGQLSLLIGRNLPGIGSYGAYVSFLISDKYGHSPEGRASAVDRFTKNPENFPNAVMRNWIALPPKCSYSFPIDVRGYAPEFFEKKGFYKVQAVYSSTGIRTQVMSQHLEANDEDIKKLPFAAWEGTVESNELWIEIVRRPAVH